MSSDRRPSTPPSGIPIPQFRSSHSTPHSQGSGSHYSFQEQMRQDDYKPYLMEDIKHKYTLETFDDFLRYVLHFDSSDWIKKNESLISDIVSAEEFKAYVDHYREAVDGESHRYSRFVVLVNHVVEKLDEKLPYNLTFCRNDPTIVKGSSGARKPDVVGVRGASVGVGATDPVDELKKQRPNRNDPFWWTELLSFWEFKLVHKSLLKTVEASTGDDSLTVKPPPGGSSAKSKSRKKDKEPEAPYHSMTTRALTRANATAGSHPPSPLGSSSTSAAGSKRPSQATDSDMSHRAKRRKGELADEVMLQCASYALEMLSHGGLRSHVIGGLITDGTIQLLYYDRSIIIISPPLNFLDESSRFLATLHAIANLSLPQWGYPEIHELVPAPLLKDPRQVDILRGMELRLENGTRLELEGMVFHQHGLICRGTCVIRARCVEKALGADDEAWDGQLIVKLSWPASSRTPEHLILERAYKKAAEDEKHRWVLDRLPKVLHAEDRDVNILSPELIELMGDRYEERVLRILVQEELEPITMQTTAPDLAKSFRDIFKCYRWLFDEAEIMHRDISLGNLMIRKRGDETYGVLTDFDLAAFREDVTSPSSKQRTGTQPFMAIDLLESDLLVHMYRHDLESMFYVLLWITSRFDQGQEIADPPLHEWENIHGQTLADKKSNLVLVSAPTRPTPDFESLRGWIDPMQDIIHDGYWARTKYVKGPQTSHFDHETLGGSITFEKFEEILNIEVP